MKIEVALVFAVQLVLVSGLVQLDRIFSLGGNLHAIVGVVFVLLPVLVLDRRDKPYERYGIAWSPSLKDIVWVAAAMAVTFPPIVAFGPWVWGLKETHWSFVWPQGYPGVALSHLVIVALPEEIFYRAYLMGRLDDIFKKRFNLLGAQVGWGLPIQAVLFGLGHVLVDFNPARFAVAISALAFGWLKAKRGTIIAPILFHAAANIFMEIFRAGLGL